MHIWQRVRKVKVVVFFLLLLVHLSLKEYRALFWPLQQLTQIQRTHPEFHMSLSACLKHRRIFHLNSWTHVEDCLDKRGAECHCYSTPNWLGIHLSTGPDRVSHSKIRGLKYQPGPPSRHQGHLSLSAPRPLRMFDSVDTLTDNCDI